MQISLLKCQVADCSHHTSQDFAERAGARNLLAGTNFGKGRKDLLRKTADHNGDC